MRKLLTLALLMLLLASCGHAQKGNAIEKSPTGRECSVPKSATRGEDFMKAFFGNYQELIGVSALDPFKLDDPELRQWTFGGAISDLLYDWHDLDARHQAQFEAIINKIPFRFLKLYHFPNNQMLLVFEAGAWDFYSSSWGGSGALMSHNLGMAAFKLKSGVWQLTGYNLNLGRFGSYCTTRLQDKPIKIGKNDYAVLSKDVGYGVFGIVDGNPVVLLRIPHFRSFGHGDPEDFDSEIVFEPSRGNFYDIVVKSSGKNWDTEEKLNHFRRWVWSKQLNRYELKESQGNIQNILITPNSWLLDEES
ncbi:MAG: hypothetical protein WCY21_04370 [Candidatus Cloacimonadaceae bacterium]|jgi:hypothetical protein|nr:hypothetical protein [Candidatus Cloacimonadota bacterium]MDX9949458.1 hypothetical protein [Candidatus Syntrophosphaera sp.]NLN84783.1 hypothetical protein [Candidatus Cloacimonadota bacterium]